jgi:hypothetical protein
MVAPNIDNLYRSPGRLVKNPTALQSPYPHGGVELGIARDILFRPKIQTETLIAEEFKTAVEVVFTGQMAVIAGVMRTWDNDMMTTLFYGQQIDSRGNIGLNYNASGNRAGKALSSKGIVLLFSPMAVDAQKHILIYNAVPVVDEAFEMKVSLAEELGIPFFFQALPDVYGRVYAVDFRANLSL